VEQYKLDTFFLEVAIILVQGSSHSRLVQKQDCNYEKMNHLSRLQQLSRPYKSALNAGFTSAHLVEIQLHHLSCKTVQAT